MLKWGQLSYEQRLNDVWGYADDAGNEYALVGTQTGFSIVGLDIQADTLALNELFFIDGPTSTWRDIKTAYNRAYVVNEEADGILIVDLSMLPDSIAWHRFNADSTLSSAHNIFIDEYNIAYVAGYNDYDNSITTDDRGVMMFELNTDPDTPQLIGNYTDFYAHDVYVRDSIMYTSEIYEGQIAIIDVSDPQNYQILGRQSTPSNFTHNAWLSDDSQYIYTTDEVSNAYIGAYDISDYSQIQEVDRYQSNPGDNVTPHNVHVKDDFLVISYYKDGVVVVDATEPDLMVPVEQYDTYPESGGGTRGCWGAYPFLPSGRILATDREEGLFVTQPSYNRAGYVRGNVADSQTGNSITGVQVRIAGSDQLRYTNLFGEYKAGIYGTQSNRSIVFSKFGYESKTITPIVLESGTSQILNVTLDPIPPIPLSVRVIDDITGELITEAQVEVFNEDLFFEGTTDNDGTVLLSNEIPQVFDIIVGKWGYESRIIQQSQLDSTGYEVRLTPGYYDDFYFDYQWTYEEGNNGNWERGNPIGSTLDTEAGIFCNPEFDADGDIGVQAFVTGNSTGLINGNDVDGVQILRSPSFNLGFYPEPQLNFSLWYCSNDTIGTESQVEILLSNGQEEVSILNINFATAQKLSDWQEYSFPIREFISPTGDMQLSIVATELSETDWLTEVAFDAFSISDSLINLGINLVANDQNNFTLYPNPFSNTINILPKYQGTLEVYNANGKLLLSKEVFDLQSMAIGESFAPGLYLIKWSNGEMEQTERVVKY